MDPRPPQLCPSCGSHLQIDRLRCTCGVAVEGHLRWPRLARLSPDDQQLVELLILMGASLKDVAHKLDISYPTLRKRIDILIKRLQDEIQKDSDFRVQLLKDVAAGRKSAMDARKEMGQ